MLQRERIGARAGRDRRRQGCFRVVLLHHSPLARRTQLGANGCTDASDITEVLMKHGAELVIHGHGHEERIDRLDGAHRSAARSSRYRRPRISALGRAGWNQYRISVPTAPVAARDRRRDARAPEGSRPPPRETVTSSGAGQPRNRAHVSLTSRQSSIESTSTAASACATITGRDAALRAAAEFRKRFRQRQTSDEVAQEQSGAEHPHDAPRPLALLLDVAPEDRDRVAGRLQHREQIAAAVGVVAEMPTGAASARKRRHHVVAARECPQRSRRRSSSAALQN